MTSILRRVEICTSFALILLCSYTRVTLSQAAAAAVATAPTMKSSPSRLTLRDAKSSLYDLLAAAQHDDAEHMHSSVLEEDDAYSSGSNSGSHPGSGRHSSATSTSKYKLCDACSNSNSSSSNSSSKGELPCGHQAAAAGHLSCLKALRDSGEQCYLSNIACFYTHLVHIACD
jgi:hypothetical protein